MSFRSKQKAKGATKSQTAKSPITSYAHFVQHILSRGGVREHKARGQGQGHKKNPRPRTHLPWTDPFEAKDRNARGQGQGLRTQRGSVLKKKKKVSFKTFANLTQIQAFSKK